MIRSFSHFAVVLLTAASLIVAPVYAQAQEPQNQNPPATQHDPGQGGQPQGAQSQQTPGQAQPGQTQEPSGSELKAQPQTPAADEARSMKIGPDYSKRSEERRV